MTAEDFAPDDTVRPRRGGVVDGGSISIWLLCVGALTLFVATVIGARDAALLARHRAEGAADLAALAAAARIGLGSDACPSAARLARANGAAMRFCRVELDADGRSGVVTVRVAAAVRLPLVGRKVVAATARAGRLPTYVAIEKRLGG